MLAPLQDPYKLDRAVADLLARLAAPDDADDLADTLDTLQHKVKQNSFVSLFN